VGAESKLFSRSIEPVKIVGSDRFSRQRQNHLPTMSKLGKGLPVSPDAASISQPSAATTVTQCVWLLIIIEIAFGVVGCGAGPTLLS
jgi:hypothetical protein